MRTVIHLLALFGCIVVVRGEDGSGTNTGRPTSIQAARVIKQFWLRPELNVGTNAVVLGTNAVTLERSEKTCVSEGESPSSPEARLPEFKTKVMNGKV